MGRIFGLCLGTVAAAALLLAACAGDGEPYAAPSATSDSTALPEDTPTPPPTRPGRLPGDATATVPRPSIPARTPMARSPGCGLPAARGDSVGELATEQGPRSYRLHVPARYNPAKPAPLVLNFHGYGQDAAQQEAWSGLGSLADSKGFILVTPEGSGSPAGWDIPGVYNENGIDDVLFVEQLIADLSARLCIDQRRVFATGHSNGGEMAAQVACFLPDLIAAVAPVAGPVFQECQGRAVPMLAFQGTEDFNVTYDESASAVEEWAAHNGCSGEPTAARLAEHVTRLSWRKCAAEVLFVVVEGMGHTWPGATIPGGVGPATDEIDASRLMWEFFARHPKK